MQLDYVIAQSTFRPVRLFTYVESNRDYDKLPFELHKNYLRKMRREEKQKDPKVGLNLDLDRDVSMVRKKQARPVPKTCRREK